jgi:acyl-CoA thioesterase FadM
VRAKITVACVTGDALKPAEIPDALRRKMQASL